MKWVLLHLSIFFAGCGTIDGLSVSIIEQNSATSLQPWQSGYLDIHHINTGNGDAAFFVFPDGTTMLFDAGDLNREHLEKYAPLKAVKPHPNDRHNSGTWIAQYIDQALPGHVSPRLDFVVISHFHDDHYGAMRPGLELSKRGDFYLTGVTAVAEELPVGMLIDRAGPHYDYPVDLKAAYSQGDEVSTFENYLSFIKSTITNTIGLVAGRNDQITLQYDRQGFPEFEVRNVKVNGDIWTGEANDKRTLFTAKDVIGTEGKLNENPLSLALKISYGDFDYFTGGDMTGLRGFGLPTWFDVETPVGKVVGEIDALALNHHGNRDATNESFLAALTPRVIVQQTWISDHPGGEVAHRITSQGIYSGDRDIFATNILDETKIAIGPWLTNNYTSMQGHVLIRVSSGGKQYFVMVLDDTQQTLQIQSIHGPYLPR